MQVIRSLSISAKAPFHNNATFLTRYRGPTVFLVTHDELFRGGDASQLSARSGIIY